jgi:hypothetical protein
MKTREKIISYYPDGYNKPDIDRMVGNFDENITFENIANGETTMKLTGLASFKEQAEQAKSFFTSRTQTIRSYRHRESETEIQIDYYSILAIDLPNGLKKGNELKLQGKSIFTFSGNKIIELIDIS